MKDAAALKVVLVVPALLAASCADPRPPEPLAGPANAASAPPAIHTRSRMPDVKVLEIVDAKTVRVRTDRVTLERLHGDTLVEDWHFIDGTSGAIALDPKARAPDEMTFSVGETCEVGVVDAQRLALIKIEGGAAIFHWTGTFRGGRPVDDVVAVRPYRDGHWEGDPNDADLVTYTETDEAGRARLVKQYRKGRLEGRYATFFSSGQQETEARYHEDQADGAWTDWYPNGQKRHHALYVGGKAMHEIYWREDGAVSSTSDPP